MGGPDLQSAPVVTREYPVLIEINNIQQMPEDGLKTRFLKTASSINDRPKTMASTVASSGLNPPSTAGRFVASIFLKGIRFGCKGSRGMGATRQGQLGGGLHDGQKNKNKF
jgi:hypothetical protein